MNVDPRPLLDDVLWLPHSDPGGVAHGLPTNAYVLIRGDEALAVDAAFGYLLDPLERIAEAGHRSVGLILTHRHLAGNGDVFGAFQARFHVPVLLHSIDIAHPQAQVAGIDFTPVEASDLPARFDLEVILFPGQTEGSVMLWRGSDGLLLTGDSAMSTTTPQHERGVRRIVRPPVGTSVDDSGLRERWAWFNRPVQPWAPTTARRSSAPRTSRSSCGRSRGPR